MSVEEQILLKEILDQLQAGGITADISDRAARLLGVTYGSQGQQILQRAVSFDLLAQLRNAGIEIDPRSIRNLVFATDKVDISGSSLPLPTGASTEATAALIKAKTDNLDALLSTRLATADIQPSSTGSIFNTALPAAEANWLTSDISITAHGTMRVTVQVTVAGILRAAITRSAVTKTLNVNQNTSLTASALYVFDAPVKSGDTFNLKYSVTTGTIDYCEVQFIKGAA